MNSQREEKPGPGLGIGGLVVIYRISGLENRAFSNPPTTSFYSSTPFWEQTNIIHPVL